MVDARLRTDGGMRFLMALRATPELCRVPVLTVTDRLVDVQALQVQVDRLLVTAKVETVRVSQATNKPGTNKPGGS